MKRNVSAWNALATVSEQDSVILVNIKSNITHPYYIQDIRNNSTRMTLEILLIKKEMSIQHVNWMKIFSFTSTLVSFNEGILSNLML